MSEGKATEIQGAGRVCREHRAAPAPFWLAAQQQSSSQEWGAATEMSILGERKQEKLTWAAEPITQKRWRRATRRPAWKLNQMESAREKVLEEETLREVLGALQHGFVKLSLLSVLRVVLASSSLSVPGTR